MVRLVQMGLLEMIKKVAKRVNRILKKVLMNTVKKMETSLRQVLMEMTTQQFTKVVGSKDLEVMEARQSTRDMWFIRWINIEVLKYYNKIFNQI